MKTKEKNKNTSTKSSSFRKLKTHQAVNVLWFFFNIFFSSLTRFETKNDLGQVFNGEQFIGRFRAGLGSNLHYLVEPPGTGTATPGNAKNSKFKKSVNETNKNRTEKNLLLYITTQDLPSTRESP